MELRRRRLRPAGIRQPLSHPLAPRRGQLVDLAVRTIGLTDTLCGHQATAFEASQRYVYLAGVQRLRKRTEGELKSRTQLIAVRRLLGQQREQYLLYDPQLVAVRRLFDRYAWGVRHQISPLANRYLDQTNR